MRSQEEIEQCIEETKQALINIRTPGKYPKDVRDSLLFEYRTQLTALEWVMGDHGRFD